MPSLPYLSGLLLMGMFDYRKQKPAEQAVKHVGESIRTDVKSS
jgi:hypothetical protein